jgi:hypothetical protein
MRACAADCHSVLLSATTRAVEALEVRDIRLLPFVQAR